MITWGLCTNAIGSKGAPAFPPPYAPPPSILERLSWAENSKLSRLINAHAQNYHYHYFYYYIYQIYIYIYILNLYLAFSKYSRIASARLSSTLCSMYSTSIPCSSHLILIILKLDNFLQFLIFFLSKSKFWKIALVIFFILYVCNLFFYFSLWEKFK